MKRNLQLCATGVLHVHYTLDLGMFNNVHGTFFLSNEADRQSRASSKPATRFAPDVTSLHITLVKLHTGRRSSLDLLRGPLSPSPTSIILTTLTAKKHIAHHIHERVALARDLDSEILLANLGQELIPNTNVPDLRRVVRSQLFEQICASALDGQQQQADEVEQG